MQTFAEEGFVFLQEAGILSEIGIQKSGRQQRLSRSRRSRFRVHISEPSAARPGFIHAIAHTHGTRID